MLDSLINHLVRKKVKIVNANFLEANVTYQARQTFFLSCQRPKSPKSYFAITSTSTLANLDREEEDFKMSVSRRSEDPPPETFEFQRFPFLFYGDF